MADKPKDDFSLLLEDRKRVRELDKSIEAAVESDEPQPIGMHRGREMFVMAGKTGEGQ